LLDQIGGHRRPGVISQAIADDFEADADTV